MYLPSGRGDHPRGCGEKGGGLLGLHACEGSSPRVRGEAVAKRSSSGMMGIIPAGAGRSRP